MGDRWRSLTVPLDGLLGYLNFSAGKPDPRFQSQFNALFKALIDLGAEEPWRLVDEVLSDALLDLRAQTDGPFRDTEQAEKVLDLVFQRVLPAYRKHHDDLLFHRGDMDLFQPFFLVRVIEAALSEGAPWTEADRIVRGAMNRLNDYVGHRPIALLATRPKGEPYEHERCRPIPIYLRGAGVAVGPYQELVARALDWLEQTERPLLADAHFDLEALEELALDPRAFDHGHPANKRTNYIFGEWDPHHLGKDGRYTRFILRPIVLDALLERAHDAAQGLAGLSIGNSELPTAEEAMSEAAAVLAATMLMASAVSGSSPTAHDSTVSLRVLIPRIAQLRESFYEKLMARLPSWHARRLEQERAATRQALGLARQHLNHYLARQRAFQLQQRQLALLFAEMGFADASRRQAAQIPTPSIRMTSTIRVLLATGQVETEEGKLDEVAGRLPEIERLIRRGIDCGALADPWNILGFQALYPLFQAQEDAVRDARIDELVAMVDHLFSLYAHVLSEAGGQGRDDLVQRLLPAMERLATWWDQFASVEVGDVQHVHGDEAVASARHVSRALAHWHERGEAAGDLAFWRNHLDGFHSPKAFALVVEALLRKEDFKASMALLVNWLGQAESVSLEDGEFSFHDLSLRWLLELTRPDRTDAEVQGTPRLELVRKFIDFLEANADEFAQLRTETMPNQAADASDEEDSIYGAAYEGVTFKDSADDDNEGALMESGPQRDAFDLEEEESRLTPRLKFLSTLARLWQIGSQPHLTWNEPESLEAWLESAQLNQNRLLSLMDVIHAHPLGDSSDLTEEMAEYDRRRMLKEQLLYSIINTALDTSLALGTIQCALDRGADHVSTIPRVATSGRPSWEPCALRMEKALFHADAGELSAALPEFLNSFQEEPLLVTVLADGGQPRSILRTRIAQSILRALLANLPALGLLRETGTLLTTARTMEQAHPPAGRGVTEFNNLFQVAFQSVAETVVHAFADKHEPDADEQLVGLLYQVARPYLQIWVDHSQTLQLSVLETLRTDTRWQALAQFIQRYGADLFQVRFMTVANLRGILHRGIAAYLERLREEADPLHPIALVEDLDKGLAREDVVAYLQVILQAVLENYEEYRDFSSTTTQSDYGDHLYVLLDFLRLKADYDRIQWQFRPLVLAHEVLVRSGRTRAAVIWENEFAARTAPYAERLVQALEEMERAYGVRLRTVSERVQERFTRPLALDRLCSLIEPAMNEPAGGEAFARLEQAIAQFGDQPSGVGLDVPLWLRRLDHEVQRVWAGRTSIAVLAERHFRLTRVKLGMEDIRRQVDEA